MGVFGGGGERNQNKSFSVKQSERKFLKEKTGPGALWENKSKQNFLLFSLGRRKISNEQRKKSYGNQSIF